MESVNIGNIKLKNRLVLAPMAGITDIAFRILCKRLGAGLIYTEMVNANAISINNKSMLKKALFSEEEKPITVQLFGAKTGLIVKAAKILESLGADIIDFNFGCPDSQVIKQGAGSALLKRPKKIEEIISALVKAVKIPVTAKMRINEKYLEIAGIIEKAGASALAVHARTVKQGYSGKADWQKIKEIKSILSIPVIGSGDIFKPEDAKKMIEETGCDLVMIGRGTIGNPQIFRDTLNYLDNKIVEKISDKDKIELFFQYLELAEKHELRFSQIKRQALNFTKGIKDATKLRPKISITKNAEELKKLIKSVFWV